MRFGGRAYKSEDVEQIGYLGLDFAEINFPEEENWAHQTQDFLRKADKWDLPYLVHAAKEGNPNDIQQLEGRFFQEILRLLEACRELSAPLLTIHFWMDSRFVPEEVRGRKREILWAMAREGRRMGVQLCLENLSESPEDIQPLLAGCPELGLTLDIGHGQILSQRNRSADFLERWPGRIHHVHAHDNRGGDRVEDDLHLPIGEGEIDFGEGGIPKNGDLRGPSR
ncbi:MAG: sugar phosphate isomerase/epimerase family protein [Thermodesulfobacteriota bacterium]